MFAIILTLACTNTLTRFNPDDVRSDIPNDCSDTAECDFGQASGLLGDESSAEQVTPFNGFSGYTNQTFVFDQGYQDQDYTNCSIEMSLEATGVYDGNGCSECDLLGESSANLVADCSFAENASGRFRMGIDTDNEVAYSYRDDDGWQPLYDSSACNRGLNISSETSSLSVRCIYDGDGYTQETEMNIRW